jgi:Fe-S-cluster containining protein
MFRAGASGPQFAAAMARAAESERRFSEMRGLLAHADPDKTDVLEMAAKFRVPCPLKQDHVCMLYESRPITCRVYGAPQQIGSRVVSCPKTGFEPGRSYTTVNMAEIQRRLAAASGKFLADMLGMRIKSGAPLYSLPEALRTEFNRDYFLKLKAALS